MPAKPKNNWNDVQTAIATTAIVTTLGMWNLFATPVKAEEATAVQPEEEAPVSPAPPLRDPPPGYPLDVPKPYVKIMFTQAAPQTTTNVQQPQEKKKRKKKNKDNGGGGGGGNGGGGSVTSTQSS
jgi:hypothetical protein